MLKLKLFQIGKVRRLAFGAAGDFALPADSFLVRLMLTEE